MLRNHFQHSQFIVVSLKEGMFNNANVLYKTKFVDGVSTVTRYTQNVSTATTAAAAASSASSTTRENKDAGSKAKRQRMGSKAVLQPHMAN